MSLLEVYDAYKVYRSDRGENVFALNGVSLTVDAGSTVAVIGESGSGKSTLGRICLGLLEADGGEVRFDGADLSRLSPTELRRLRARLQVVFQEPFASLNPRMRVGSILEEPLRIHRPDLDRGARQRLVSEIMEQVGLDPRLASLRPARLSGGQQQRVGIARAVITRPALVVLDEPTSSLDLSVRAQILTLLRQLQAEIGLAYLFISHDIATVDYVADYTIVMYLGRVVEQGPTETVLSSPRHPYTRALLSARLAVDPSERPAHVPLVGELPKPGRRPTGCVLCGRCPIEIKECSDATVTLEDIGEQHQVACVRRDVLWDTGHDPLQRE